MYLAGFRMLTVAKLSTRTALSLGSMPKTLFLFDVNYVTRRHKVIAAAVF